METLFGVAAILGCCSVVAVIDYVFSCMDLTDNDPVRD
jgi:hypothetical protein